MLIWPKISEPYKLEKYNKMKVYIEIEKQL